MTAKTPASVAPVLVDRAGLKAMGVYFSNPWLLKLEAEGTFPKRISLGARRVHWVLSEVQDYIARRIAQRDVAAETRRRLARPHAIKRRSRSTIDKSSVEGSETATS
jgi:prophage regulatory protein